MSGSRPNTCVPKALAQAAEAGDDLVDDEQDVVLLQDRLHALEVARRRDDHAAGALHRLGDEGGDGVGAFAARSASSSSCARRSTNCASLSPGSAAAVEVRRADAQDAGQRQVEVLVHRGQARHRRRRRGDAVVALLARDDLLLQRPAAGVVVVAHQLERGVVGLRARVGEQHAAASAAPASAPSRISLATSSVTGPGTLPENEW